MGFGEGLKTPQSKNATSYEKENTAYGVWQENLKKRDHFEIGADGRIILKWRLKKLGHFAWIGLAQIREKRSALVYAVINIRVHKMKDIP